MKTILTGIALLGFLFAASAAHAQDEQPAKEKTCKKVWIQTENGAKQDAFIIVKVCK